MVVLKAEDAIRRTAIWDLIGHNAECNNTLSADQTALSDMSIDGRTTGLSVQSHKEPTLKEIRIKNQKVYSPISPPPGYGQILIEQTLYVICYFMFIASKCFSSFQSYLVFCYVIFNILFILMMIILVVISSFHSKYL